MAGFRLRENRTEPRPDRRLGIKLETATDKQRLGGKLDAYLPPELQYDYRTPSVFARYKVLTALFVALTLVLLGLWMALIKRPQPLPPGNRPAAQAPRLPQAPQSQPVYIEPLPAK